MTPAEKEEWRDPAGTRRLDALPAGKQAPAAERNAPVPYTHNLEILFLLAKWKLSNSIRKEAPVPPQK
ncbi:hypothetical protein ANABIO32_21980 [Rossellomorea marisflavi]|nr:hypothetical protein ANABIO32_21980 [Rossellomorea marisflavi]